MKQQNKERTREVIKLVGAFITIATLIILVYALINSIYLNEEVSDLIYIYGIPALFISSIILDLIPQLISPIIALATGIIAGLNIHLAILATALGSIIGSLIGFALGKKYMFKAIGVLIPKESVKKLTTLTNKYGKIIVPIAAISPLPYFSSFLGAINLSKKNFIIYGIIPRTLGIIAYGYLINLLN